MRSRDNLKKLFFIVLLSREWPVSKTPGRRPRNLQRMTGRSQAFCDALDLATALIKLSRLMPIRSTPAFYGARKRLWLGSRTCRAPARLG